MDPQLSLIGKKMSQLTGVRFIMQDIIATLQAGAESKWINLSPGNPVILPEIEDMWRKYTQAILTGPDFGAIVGRYGSSQGYEPLLDAVVDLFNTDYHWGITRRNVLVTPGSQTLYFLAANCFGGYDEAGRLRPIVLPLCPDYTGYDGVVFTENMLHSHKPTLDILDPHRFKYRPDFDQLQKHRHVGAILFSRPCNPTGYVLTDTEVQRIVDLAASNNVPVLIDSAYALPFPNLVFTEMKPIWGRNVIHCISLSKAGLPGERVGIAIGDEHYISLLESFQSYINLHSSRYGQAIAAQAISSGELARLSKTLIKPYYQHKYIWLTAALDQEMPDVPWYLHSGEGSIFAWLWLQDLPITDMELYRELKREQVLVVPGTPFFMGLKEGWSHKHQCIRISLTATEEELACGVAVIARVLEQVYNPCYAKPAYRRL